MYRPLLIFCNLISLFLLTSAQSCVKYTFASKKIYSNCNDLPYLNSFLHYSYNSSSQTIHIAYRHTGINAARWVAWGINPHSKGMVGTQAIIAFRKSDGTMSVYTSPVTSYKTNLAKGKLKSIEVANLSATYLNNEITVFATIKLATNNITSLNQVWQDGPITNGNSLGMHSTSGQNVQSMSNLNLVSRQSGQVAKGGSPNSKIKKKNIHGVLNTVSWGMMMPLGAIIARYFKVFKVTTPAWFYIHSTCQTSAYIIGVVGWATGLRFGTQSPAIIQLTVHRTIGIVLFCLATIQVTALLLRPKRENKYRKYWNIYHHGVGYVIIVLGVFNVFKGLNILKPKGDWERDYIIFLWFLAAFAAFMEIYTWIVVLKRKRADDRTKKYSSFNGLNETNNDVDGFNGPQRATNQHGVVV